VEERRARLGHGLGARGTAIETVMDRHTSFQAFMLLQFLIDEPCL